MWEREREEARLRFQGSVWAREGAGGAEKEESGWKQGEDREKFPRGLLIRAWLWAIWRVSLGQIEECWVWAPRRWWFQCLSLEAFPDEICNGIISIWTLMALRQDHHTKSVRKIRWKLVLLAPVGQCEAQSLVCGHTHAKGQDSCHHLKLHCLPRYPQHCLGSSKA